MLEDLQLERDLTVAVERGEIVVYFQPQVDLASERVVAMEALARWKHPQRGIVGPDAFIPIAERNGVIHTLGEAVLQTACRYASSVASKFWPVEVAVNASADQLTTPWFFDRIHAHLAHCELEARYLTIEVTESQAIGNPEIARQLGVLREEGFGISIDDVWPESVSTDRVLALPATELKVDRSVLYRDDDDEGLRSLVALGRERGLRVVAEGVETRGQLARVKAAGCDRAQGYLFGRPGPSDDMDDLLASTGD